MAERDAEARRGDEERRLSVATFSTLFEAALTETARRGFGLSSPAQAADELKKLLDRFQVESIPIRGAESTTPEIPRMKASNRVELDYYLRRRLPFELGEANRIDVDLNSKFLGAETLIFLLEQLLETSSHERVRAMDLTNNGAFTKELSEALGRFLRAPGCGLRRLQLAHCGLDDALLEPILSGLKENRSLETLVLFYNAIGEASCPAIEELVRTHPTLGCVELCDAGRVTNKLSRRSADAVENAVRAKLEARRRARASSGVESGR